MPALLITSGTYITGGLATEFGALPVALLPFGLRCAFEMIIDRLGVRGEPIYLSLPHDFLVTHNHAALVRRCGVQILRTDPSASIGRAIAAAVDQIVANGVTSDLVLCHGDTIPEPIDLRSAPDDFFAVGRPSEYHTWGGVFRSPSGRYAFARADMLGVEDEALAGLFRFSAPGLLTRHLSRADGDWLLGLGFYVNESGAQRLPVERWVDLGSQAAYHGGKRAMMRPRAFNELRLDGHFVRKQSRDRFKMTAEYAWYGSLPDALRVYVPAVAGPFEDEDEAGYAVEYLAMPTLADMLLFGQLPAYAWRRALRGCVEIQAAFAGRHDTGGADGVDPEAFYREAIVEKTRRRLRAFCDASGFDGRRPIRFDGCAMLPLLDFCEAVLASIPPTQQADIGLVHGDFCASNLLFDFASGRIKMIDPRGYFLEGRVSPLGDRRYDLAKLAHSFIGLYDFVVADHADLSCATDGDETALGLTIHTSAGLPEVQRLFESECLGFDSEQRRGTEALMISLFLSMLALHGDDPGRQMALLANAYRLAAPRRIGLR